MKKYLLQALLAAVILSVGILIIMKFSAKSEPSPVANYTDKVRSDLYAGALSLFDAQINLLPFRPQTINGQEVGSSTGIRLEWTRPEQAYNHFLLTVTQPETGWKRIESREGQGFSLDVSDLLPDTKYVFDLQACLDPKCSSWFMATEEPTIRTQKMFVQRTDDVIDSSNTNIETLEPLNKMITVGSMVFLDKNGLVETIEQKNQLTFGAVFFDKTTLQSYLQIHQGDGTDFVKLLNP